MIAQHARLARTLAESSGCRTRCSTRWAGPTSGGTGGDGPEQLAGDNIPIASRIGQLAEFVEVAHRTGGVDAAVSVATRRSGTQFDPALVQLFCDEPDGILDGLDDVASWDAVIAAEPALTVVLSGERFRGGAAVRSRRSSI